MNQSKSTTLPHGAQRYVPHVDGIRAVAILPVVVYHLAARFCPGGFTGVDVFFVISGYLITAGIISDLKGGRYSITEFYVRRIKRILPAYLAVIAFVLACLPLFFTVTDSWSISKTALCSLLYSANVYFNSLGSYFDLGARENPLLHLWSLGVEEQFYLVIPFCIWLLWAIKKSFFLPNLIFLFVVSLLASVLTLRAGHAQFAFFMLPSRAWELLAGAILSQLPAVQPSKPDGVNSLNWPAGLGALLILFTYVFYNDDTVFPGFNALPAVGGAALLIRYGGLGFFNKILSSSPMVFVGKVSYSLYLWHWPIFVILRSGNNVKQAVAGVVATILATYLSWRFIETPIRQFKGFKAKHAFTLLIVGSVILAGAGALILRVPEHNGELAARFHGMETWRNHENRPFSTFEELTSNTNASLLKLGNQQGTPTFLLWGDSHALALLPGLDTVAAERGITGYYVNYKQTFTANHAVGYAYDPDAEREPVYRWLAARPEIKSVFIINRWLFRLQDESDINEVISVCDRLHQMGKQVYYIQSVPLANLMGARLLSWGFKVPESRLMVPARTYNSMMSAVGEDRLIHELTARGLATVLPVNHAFLVNGYYHVGTSTQSYYADNNHLNDIGAAKEANFIAPLVWPTQTKP